MRFLPILCLSSALLISATAFTTKTRPSTPHSIHQMAAKGFGSSGGGFGGQSTTKSKKKVKKSELKKTQQKILQKYGTDIAKGTQQRVEQAMNELPAHLRMATQIYQQLQKWNTRLDNMSVLEQTKILEQDMEGARRAQDELNRLYQEHNFNENDLHNLFQQITWDASADAKAARALTGDMPKDIAIKVDKACEIVAQPVLQAGKQGRCLDVGCGFGVLVPHLVDAGLTLSQIHGIDLSKEMIKNARAQHRGANFEAVDFMEEYHDEEGFDGVIFCSALHDLADSTAALQKAASLVRSKGKLVIAHPQGASHVLRQSAANPVLVKRGLPTAEELKSLNLPGMQLEIEPVAPNSPEEAKEGYLAVFAKA